MSSQLRKFILLSGFLLLLGGGVLWWRATHPPLSDQEQVLSDLNALSRAVEARQPRGVTGFLAKEFTFNGTGREDVVRNLKIGLIEARTVQFRLSNVEVTVRGEEATSVGRYRLTANTRNNPDPQTRMGGFTLHWRKQDGNWRIVKADVEGNFE